MSEDASDWREWVFVHVGFGGVDVDVALARLVALDVHESTLPREDVCSVDSSLGERKCLALVTILVVGAERLAEFHTCACNVLFGAFFSVRPGVHVHFGFGRLVSLQQLHVQLVVTLVTPKVFGAR